jgi:predicted aminopeptidase
MLFLSQAVSITISNMQIPDTIIRSLRRRVGLFAMLASLLLCGCAVTAYLQQSISGQLDLLRRAQPIDTMVADAQTPPDLRVRLEKVLAIRDFASRELLLPDNGSYRRYTDIQRPYVIWNVFAAPELLSRLVEWCFPIAGCVGYRGYFHHDDALKFAESLRREGFDVYVGGVPAYSTLGYFDDPVLSTFISYPETEIARLLFHELAHQVAYARDDSMFNESFAVAVEREGMRRYLAGAPAAELAAYADTTRRREDFLRLVSGARRHLDAAYASAGGDAAKRLVKTRAIEELRQSYQQLKNEKWGGYAGYDAWFAADLNNAKLASIAVYSARVPAFDALLRAKSGNLAAFYAEVKRLANMPKAERDALLDAAGGSMQAAVQAASAAASE